MLAKGIKNGRCSPATRLRLGARPGSKRRDKVLGDRHRSRERLEDVVPSTTAHAALGLTQPAAQEYPANPAKEFVAMTSSGVHTAAAVGIPPGVPGRERVGLSARADSPGQKPDARPRHREPEEKAAWIGLGEPVA